MKTAKTSMVSPREFQILDYAIFNLIFNMDSRCLKLQG
jgi:hypothetical protein